MSTIILPSPPDYVLGDPLVGGRLLLRRTPENRFVAVGILDHEVTQEVLDRLNAKPNQP